MVLARSGVDEIAAFVHTHGTRLVRLAHLLDVADAAGVAADAMASTLLRGGRDRDAQDELLEAARAVGSRAQPPVLADARLEGWLDRAELNPYKVDVVALSRLTQQALRASREALRRRRQRLAAGAAVIGMLATAGSLWPRHEEAELAKWRVEGSGILSPNDPFRNGGDPDVTVSTSVPPASQRFPRDVQAAGVELRGRAITIMQTSVFDGVDVATMLAVGCSNENGVRAVCLVLAPPIGALSQIEDEAVVAFQPIPRRGQAVSAAAPSVLRDGAIEALTDQTLLVDTTSPDVATALVTYTDGSQVRANQYHLRRWGARLFAARNKDVQPTEVVYFGPNGKTLARRSLHSVSP